MKRPASLLPLARWEHLRMNGWKRMKAMWKRLGQTLIGRQVDPRFVKPYYPTRPPKPLPWATRDELVFALAVAVLLVIVNLGHPGGVVYKTIGLVLQLLGGTFFAVGALGGEIHRIEAWIAKYLTFTSFTVKPTSLFWPIVTTVGSLVLYRLGNHLSDRALAVINFVVGGIGIVLLASLIAHLIRLPARANQTNFLRLACIAIGIALCWAGLLFIGG